MKFINIGSGKGLLPDSTKPLPGLMGLQQPWYWHDNLQTIKLDCKNKILKLVPIVKVAQFHNFMAFFFNLLLLAGIC